MIFLVNSPYCHRNAYITEFDLRKNDAPESYAVIKGRILVRIYVVYSLDTKCFNLSCIFVDYEEEVSVLR